MWHLEARGVRGPSVMKDEVYDKFVQLVNGEYIGPVAERTRYDRAATTYYTRYRSSLHYSGNPPQLFRGISVNRSN